MVDQNRLGPEDILKKYVLETMEIWIFGDEYFSLLCP